jgi:photosystem II stability/assembly factor-like uncharacterized protein
MNENAIPGAPDDVVRVFVSYAREDRRWLDPDYRYSLIPFLKESLRRHNVAFWFDKELQPGDEFKRHIETQIDQSQIALLIVSQSFLNSDFIEVREMPRIAERARLGQMIVVPVLVEPCDWSEYPFLADRQMVPSSPLIDYTESEPQWVKVRFQILDGLKAQLKRIREAPRPHGSSAMALHAHDAPPEETVIEADAIPCSQLRSQQQDEEELGRIAREAAEQEAAERGATAQAALRAEEEATQIKQQREREAEERKQWEKELDDRCRKEAAEQQTREEAQRREAELQHPMPMEAAVGGAPAKSGDDAADYLSTAQKKAVAALAVGLCLGIVCLGLYVYHRSTAPIASANPSRAQTESVPASGTVWAARNSGRTQILTSIFGTSDGQDLWAVGDDGTILESEDEGASWAACKSGTKSDLFSVFGTSDGKRLWVVGKKGTILESEDSGTTWKGQKSGTRASVSAIFGTSGGGRLWAVGGNGTILESDDGGTSWTARSGGTPAYLESIFGTSDGSRAWAVGTDGTILGSDDGGASWTPRTSGTTETLYVIFGTSDGGRLWTVGTDGTILESDDGGASWTARNSGTTQWLVSIFGASDGRHLWAVGTGGTILASGDGGATWVVRNSGTGSSLNSIFGTADGTRAWVVGYKGTILESDR